MYVQGGFPGGAARLAGGAVLLFFGGCGVSLVPGGDSGTQATLGSSISGTDGSPTYHETDANDLLELAEGVDAQSESQLISGRISSSDDVDVYDLGPVEAGDHVVVSLDADGAFEGAMALFDDGGSALLVNDHRNVYMGRNGPFVDVVVRRASQACLVALSSTPGYSATGDYALTTRVEYPTPIPAAHPDVVLLDFDASRNVRIGTRSAIDVPAFDAADISSAYSGLTREMAARIVDFVREDFAAYEVTVLSTTEGAEYDDSMTRLHFGTFDEALLGVAEGVDEFNSSSGQSAIVFTDTFAAFMPLDPTVTEMAQALANVASHEVGHLLGLIHTENPDDLMDVTAGLRELMVDQEFAKSPIYAAVFPLGYQDSVQSLLDAVGGDESLARGKGILRSKTRAEMKARVAEPALRRTCLLSGCGLEGH